MTVTSHGTLGENAETGVKLHPIGGRSKHLTALGGTTTGNGFFPTSLTWPPVSVKLRRGESATFRCRERGITSSGLTATFSSTSASAFAGLRRDKVLWLDRPSRGEGIGRVLAIGARCTRFMWFGFKFPVSGFKFRVVPFSPSKHGTDFGSVVVSGLRDGRFFDDFW
jgi:hypothetical protein